MIKNKDSPRESPSPRRKAFPSNMSRPCRMWGLHLVDSWSSRPGEPLAGLPKCVEGAGQKEVICAGLRGPARAARAAMGGVSAARLATITPPSAARALLYGSLCMAADSWSVMGMFWGLSACARFPVTQIFHVRWCGRRRQPWPCPRGWKCAGACPRGL
jgi:hypothetical protein